MGGTRQKSCSVVFYDTYQIAPIFLPGEFHGQRSLAGYSPWSHKESDTDWVTITFHQMAMALQGRCRRRGWSSGGQWEEQESPTQGDRMGWSPRGESRESWESAHADFVPAYYFLWLPSMERVWEQEWHRHRRQAEGSFRRGPGQMSLIRLFGSLGDLVNQESMKSDDEHGCHEEFQHYSHR